MTMNRTLSFLTIGTAASFAICVILLHFIQAELNPLEIAMSYYVPGKTGWLMTIALISIVLCSLLVVMQLHKTLNKSGRGKLGIWLMLVWILFGTVGIIFPADPPGQWDQPPSISGMIHAQVAVLALFALACAIPLITSVLKNRQSMLSVVSIGIVISFIALLASVVPVIISPGPPILFGLIERVFFVLVLAWLVMTSSQAK